MTTKKPRNKAPLAPKKKTPVSQKQEQKKSEPATTMKQEAETEAPEIVVETVTKTPPPVAEQSAPEKGFSNADIEEITEDLGIEPEEVEEPEPMHMGGPALSGHEDEELEEEQEASAEIISLAETEKQSKDLFYKVLCGSFDVANNQVSRGQPEGRYKSLDLSSYGEVSRAASDQFFDRLCDVPFIKRMLFKLNESSIIQNWGAIIMLGYSIHSGFKDEHTARLKERSLSSPANDNGLKEKPLKEKAA